LAVVMVSCGECVSEVVIIKKRKNEGQ
jgi:hypothetical protein